MRSITRDLLYDSPFTSGIATFLDATAVRRVKVSQRYAREHAAIIPTKYLSILNRALGAAEEEHHRHQYSTIHCEHRVCSELSRVFTLRRHLELLLKCGIINNYPHRLQLPHLTVHVVLRSELATVIAAYLDASTVNQLDVSDACIHQRAIDNRQHSR